MSTGLIESWTGNPLEVGPLYPFVGYEVHLFVVCFILWVVYTIWQMRFEAENYSDEVTELRAGDRQQRTVEKNREHH